MSRYDPTRWRMEPARTQTFERRATPTTGDRRLRELQEPTVHGNSSPSSARATAPKRPKHWIRGKWRSRSTRDRERVPRSISETRVSCGSPARGCDAHRYREVTILIDIVKCSNTFGPQLERVSGESNPQMEAGCRPAIGVAERPHRSEIACTIRWWMARQSSKLDGSSGFDLAAIR